MALKVSWGIPEDENEVASLDQKNSQFKYDGFAPVRFSYGDASERRDDAHCSGVDGN